MVDDIVEISTEKDALKSEINSNDEKNLKQKC